MKLVMTLLARNEADIVDAQIAFHLHAGVDFVIATDNRSEDGTTEILERYVREGVLHLIREQGDDMRQSEWVTRMARLAATDFDADWVINTDADEFWWPRGGSLKQVLSLVPERFAVIRGCWRHFLPRPDNDDFFAERMTVRLRAPAFPGDKTTVFHAHQKVAHRADPDVEVERGNHDVVGGDRHALRGWHPIEVLHFSIRSVEHLARKARGGYMRSGVEQPEHVIAVHRAVKEGRVAQYFDSVAVSDARLERGLADGTLVLDTRLRDALRTIRRDDGSFARPSAEPRLDFLHPTIEEDAAFAAEVSVLEQVDGIVRAEERVAALEARLAAVRTLRPR
jgi:hypothetical protein